MMDPDGSKEIMMDHDLPRPSMMRSNPTRALFGNYHGVTLPWTRGRPYLNLPE